MPKSGLGIVILQDQSKNKGVVGGGNNISMSCDGIQLNRSLNMYIGKKVAAGSIPWTHAAAGFVQYIVNSQSSRFIRCRSLYFAQIFFYCRQLDILLYLDLITTACRMLH
jgi:hypothetical protein